MESSGFQIEGEAKGWVKTKSSDADLQDDRRSDGQFGEITEKIIGCAFEVIVKLKAAKAIAPEHQA